MRLSTCFSAASESSEPSGFAHVSLAFWCLFSIWRLWYLLPRACAAGRSGFLKLYLVCRLVCVVEQTLDVEEDPKARLRVSDLCATRTYSSGPVTSTECQYGMCWIPAQHHPPHNSSLPWSHSSSVTGKGIQ